MISDPSKIDEVRFWGRIRGTKSNYYIAIATRFVGEYESPSKAFYFATESFKFERLPFVIWGLKDHMSKIEFEDFIGEPERVLMKIPPKKTEKEDEEKEEMPEMPEEELSAVNPEDEEVDIGETRPKHEKKKKQNITELERLSFVVRAIENECAVVPVGAVKIMPNHQLR